MLQVYLERHKIFEFIPALLSNRSDPPRNQLAVYAEEPGQFVYQSAWESGSMLVWGDRMTTVRTEDSGTGGPVVSERTKGSGFLRLAAARGPHA